MSETTHDLTQRAGKLEDFLYYEKLPAHAQTVKDLQAALVQAEQREAALERIIEIYESQLARVEDSQYAKPLATAGQNEQVPTVYKCAGCGYPVAAPGLCGECSCEDDGDIW